MQNDARTGDLSNPTWHKYVHNDGGSKLTARRDCVLDAACMHASSVHSFGGGIIINAKACIHYDIVAYLGVWCCGGTLRVFTCLFEARFKFLDPLIWMEVFR